MLQFSENKEKQVDEIIEEKTDQIDQESSQPLKRSKRLLIKKNIAIPKKIKSKVEPPKNENPNKRNRRGRGKKLDELEQGLTSKKIKKEQNNKEILKTGSLSLITLENEEFALVKFSIQFNGIFKLALRNLFHLNWEKRHSSCLILKAFLKENYAFLGFYKEINLDHSQKFGKLAILLKIQSDLLEFSKRSNETEKKIIDILTRILIIVALDRFGDFLFEKVYYFFINLFIILYLKKFYLVVRESASQTFGSIISFETNFGYDKLESFLKIITSFLEKKEWQVIIISRCLSDFFKVRLFKVHFIS